MAARFATIGHSNRSLEEFIEILRDAQIGAVADVRSFPRSRSNPAYNIDTLPAELSRWQIGYVHFPRLGGRRPKQPQVDEARNAFWRVRSFHNYADYALSDEFGTALGALQRLGKRANVAIMCSEAVWWRCHRRIITDYLLAVGDPVDHLMATGRTDAAQMTPGAHVTQTGKIVYPPTPETVTD